MPVAHYDEIADWYAGWVGDAAAGYSVRVRRMLCGLLGRPERPSTCVDIACGTGARAGTLRELGWRPVGFDLSRGQLRHAGEVLPVAVADAVALPVRGNAVEAATCILCHTDVPDYAAVVREAARILRPGGRFVHIGVHPAFVGAFADRTDPYQIIVDSGYHRRDRRFESFTPHGVRARIGAWHTPVAELLQLAIDADLILARVAEAGEEDTVPDVFGFAAVKR